MKTTLWITLLITALAACTMKSEAEKKVEAAEARVEKVKQEAKEKGEAVEAEAKKKVEVAEAALDRAKKEARAAAEDLEDYGYDRRAEYVVKMKAELKDREEELDALRSSGSAKAKADAEPRMALLREKLAQAKETLVQVGDATESSWDDVKAGARKSRKDLKDAFTNAREWLADKIEP